MIKIPYIKIRQRGETFYVTKVKASILLDKINFHYREPYSELERDDIIIKDKKYIEAITKRGIELHSDEEGIQRRLQVDRINSIKKFIESDTQNFLPNTVLLSADISKYPDLEEEFQKYEQQDIGEFTLPDDFLFSIIDGQHRLAGLSLVDKNIASELEIIAVILINVSKPTAAKLFADINGKQKAVNKSLIYDLYGNIEKGEATDLKRFHTICENLYRSEKSPLYRQIKMLGIGSGAISQAFFIDYVREAVNKTGLKDRNTQAIFDNLFFYFKAYQEVFPEDWPVPLKFFNNSDIDKHAEKVLKTDNSQLVKTNGFGAIMRAFPHIYKLAFGEGKNYLSLINKQKGKISWKKKPDSGTGKALQNSLLEEILKCYGNDSKKEPAIIMTNKPYIERMGLNLKANVPTDIFVKGGINYYETIFHLRYPASANGKEITLALKDANGQSISHSLRLGNEGQMTYEFSTNQDIGPNFGFLQLVSKEDLNLEIWSEISDGGFK